MFRIYQSYSVTILELSFEYLAAFSFDWLMLGHALIGGYGEH